MDLKDVFGKRDFWNSRGVRYSERISDHRSYTRKHSTKLERKAKRKQTQASRKRNRRTR